MLHSLPPIPVNPVSNTPLSSNQPYGCARFIGLRVSAGLRYDFDVIDPDNVDTDGDGLRDGLITALACQKSRWIC